MFGITKCKGSRRTTWLAGKYAIKFPTLDSWVGFLNGFRENLEERSWWQSERKWKRGERPEWQYPYLAKIHWGDRFGFCLVMERCDTETNDRYDEYHYMTAITKLANHLSQHHPRMLGDLHRGNVGFNSAGALVVIDYGWNGGGMDCYLGCPAGWSFWRWLDLFWWRHVGRHGRLAPEKLLKVEMTIVGGPTVDLLRGRDDARMGDLVELIEYYYYGVLRQWPDKSDRTLYNDKGLPNMCQATFVHSDSGERLRECVNFFISYVGTYGAGVLNGVLDTRLTVDPANYYAGDWRRVDQAVLAPHYEQPFEEYENGKEDRTEV